MIRTRLPEEAEAYELAAAGPLDWLDQAACRHCDPELFFPPAEFGAAGRDRIAAAKQVCRRCPVQATCLSWALDTGQEAGIWGGTTELERRQLRRRRHLLA
jgi:WhiB family transcriptional regulator, redox-sensing transcriptional regulator